MSARKRGCVVAPWAAVVTGVVVEVMGGGCPSCAGVARPAVDGPRDGPARAVPLYVRPTRTAPRRCLVGHVRGDTAAPVTDDESAAPFRTAHTASTAWRPQK